MNNKDREREGKAGKAGQFGTEGSGQGGQGGQGGEGQRGKKGDKGIKGITGSPGVSLKAALVGYLILVLSIAFAIYRVGQEAENRAEAIATQTEIARQGILSATIDACERNNIIRKAVIRNIDKLITNNKQEEKKLKKLVQPVDCEAEYSPKE